MKRGKIRNFFSTPNGDLNARKIVLIISLTIVFLIIFSFIWLTIRSYDTCKNWDCFTQKLSTCERSKFAGGKEVIFGYTINGPIGKRCSIDVVYLQGDVANLDARELKGKEMTCETPLGVIMLPESDLTYCHGELKEKLQERVITQLHNYIVQNLGQINKELLNPLNV